MPGVLLDSSFTYNYPAKTLESLVDRDLSRTKDWPTQLTDALSWDVEAYADHERYTHVLTDADRAEINKALEHFSGRSSITIIGKV